MGYFVLYEVFGHGWRFEHDFDSHGEAIEAMRRFCEPTNVCVIQQVNGCGEVEFEEVFERGWNFGCHA